MRLPDGFWHADGFYFVMLLLAPPPKPADDRVTFPGNGQDDWNCEIHPVAT
jgi:hypothetical protein